MSSGRRQFPPELGPPDPRPGRADRHRGQWPADSASTGYPTPTNPESTAFAGTGSTLPGFSNFPTNYFTASGALGPAARLAGEASARRPPSTTGTWVWGIATFKYVPDRHPVAGSLGSGTVIVVLKGLLNYSGAQSQFDKNFN